MIPLALMGAVVAVFLFWPYNRFETEWAAAPKASCTTKSDGLVFDWVSATGSHQAVFDGQGVKPAGQDYMYLPKGQAHFMFASYSRPSTEGSDTLLMLPYNVGRLPPLRVSSYCARRVADVLKGRTYWH